MITIKIKDKDTVEITENITNIEIFSDQALLINKNNLEKRLNRINEILAEIKRVRNSVL